MDDCVPSILAQRTQTCLELTAQHSLCLIAAVVWTVAVDRMSFPVVVPHSSAAVYSDCEVVSFAARHGV